MANAFLEALKRQKLQQMSHQPQQLPPDLLGAVARAEGNLYDKSLIYKSIKDAFTAPMRAYEGEFDPMSPYGVQEALNTAGMAMLGGMPGGARGPGSVGMITYHGSPHKFDKFDMSKIGTGEGAQAYGHGLYMAEAPEVAQSYVGKASTQIDKRPDGSYLAMVLDPSGNPFTKQSFKSKELAEAFAKENQAKFGAGSLYKVDIPDEAVARMLDWDKPLSEQAPEVQAAINKIGIADAKNGDDLYWKLKRTKYGVQESMPAHPNSQEAQAYASELMRQHGIPGIRYLDAGSRASGKGTSNLVLFDDQLPRILERNGEPTGLQPWQPGEANALLGIPSAPIRPRNALGQEIPPTQYEHPAKRDSADLLASFGVPVASSALLSYLLGGANEAEAGNLYDYMSRE